MELRENGTQAVIESILPGEEVILTATAEIPKGFTEEELINTALVYPEGEEEKGKSDQAEVIVKQKTPKDPVSGNKKAKSPQKTPTASPSPGQSRRSYVVTAAPGTSYSVTGTQTDGKGSGYVSSSPKTGDESPLLPLLLLAGGGGAVIFLILRYRCRHKK